MIEVTSLSGEPGSLTEALLGKWKGTGTRVMKVTFGDSVQLAAPGSKSLSPRDDALAGVWTRTSCHRRQSCESLGPGLPDGGEVARLWDRVTLTDDEERVIRAVNLVIEGEAARIAVVGDGARSGQEPAGRRVVVRLKEGSHPVPLKSLGDGAVRLFGAALALANSRDGFLLIDEAENGIHHAVQRDFWRMVLQTARDNNVQVLATTHGWDCVRGFAQAATELDAVDGVLVRLERRGDRIRAIEYPEEELIIAARQGIEVR